MALVKGHSGHPENERADALANRGVTSLAEG
jgi:ribonuclease HI